MNGRFFIERPVFAGVLSILLVLMGGVAWFRLPVEQYPELAPPVVRVEAFYPGASAQTIADTIAAPIEQQVNGVDGMIYMTSTSADGRYALDVSFEKGTDPDLAAVKVQNRVNAAEPRLPEEVRRQGLTAKKQSTSFVGVIAVWSEDGRYDDLFLANYITIAMKDEVARIPGIGGVNVLPAKDYGMRIWLDPDALRARGLTMTDVNAAIREQNVQVAAGVVGRQPAPVGTDFELIVSTEGRLKTPEQFAAIIVKRDALGGVVRVKDVGRVELGSQDYTTIARFNGESAAVLIAYQLPGANLVDVAGALDAKLTELKKAFPEGLSARFFYDASMFIRASLTAVQTTLLEAFALVFAVVLLFLQSLRSTIIPAITIPVALIGTFLLMALFGYSVNMLTMFGLVLAIGIVVDDAIVVVENVERNLARGGIAPKEATLRSMAEIVSPVIAITLVLMSVFLPTTALPGITGEMYRQFALTIAASTALSALNALTLSPALCALLLRPHEHGKKGFILFRPLAWLGAAFNWVFGHVTNLYGWISRGSIKAWPLSLLLFAGVLWLTADSYRKVPTGFVPNEDLGFVVVGVQMPDGASIERTQAVVGRVQELVSAVDGVKDVTSLSGFSVIDGQGPTFGNAWVVLDPWDERTKTGRDVETIMNDIRAKVAPIEEAMFLVFSLPAINGLGNTSGYDLRILDKTSLGRDTLAQSVNAVLEAANTQSKLLVSFSSFRAGTPQVWLDIDREKAIKLDVPLQTIFETLQTALGSQYVNDFNLFDRVYQVQTQADARFRIDPQTIERLEVRTRTGAMVPLGTLLDVKDTLGPERVTRYNLYPAATVNGIPAPGTSSGEALAIMEGIMAERLPRGIGFDWSTMSFQEKRAEGQGTLVFALALLLVYLILAAQYESWLLPLAVVFSIPLVIVGAMVALQVRGLDNNVFTQIGLVLLVGLGAKNAILIVEFARANRVAGQSIVDAAVDAAHTRFRPILMTSLAFILGVAPLVFAEGASASSRQALGTAVFGGMIGVTVLGLLFTPFLFAVFQWLSERRKKRATAE
ncbi:MAG: multidrug efflux RND transporter permease subunit [Planctomycetes bacterium]|nr:multidrug efflux RND transporter permease subunit [Planctomycetota bacterium]